MVGGSDMRGMGSLAAVAAGVDYHGGLALPSLGEPAREWARGGGKGRLGSRDRATSLRGCRGSLLSRTSLPVAWAGGGPGKVLVIFTPRPAATGLPPGAGTGAASAGGSSSALKGPLSTR